MTRQEALEKANKELGNTVPWISFHDHDFGSYANLDGDFDIEELEKIVAALREIRNGTSTE